LHSYEEFMTEINLHKLLKPSKLTTPSLVKNVDKIKVYGAVFNFFFEQLQPKVSFGLCYYNDEMLAMNYAAAKSKVISIDMQHGTQGPLHFAYASWTKQPSDGFDLLPSIFWCWDKESALTINEWIEN